jgi:hypothetical protein
MLGNYFSATQDRLGNWTIRRHKDGAEVYLQGQDSRAFEADYANVIDHEYTYPIGPFQTWAQHVDACLDAYEVIMP